MRKLKLDVDALQVESFVAFDPATRGGTVHGGMDPYHKDLPSTGCDGGGLGSLFGTCVGCPTVGTCIGPTYCCAPTWHTCNPSCDMSCPDWDCSA